MIRTIQLVGCCLAVLASAQAAVPAEPAATPMGAAVWLNPEQMQPDLALLDRAFTTLHPGLTRYQTKAEWDAKVQALREWMGQPRARGEAYLALARLTASVRCSHTYLNYWNQPAEVARWLHDRPDKIPVLFHLDEQDRFVVERSAAFDPVDSTRNLLEPGDVIVSIDGVPTAELVKRLLPYIRGDGGNDGKRRALIENRGENERETIDVMLPLVLPPQDGNYTLVVERQGAARTVVVAAITSARRAKTAEPKRAPRPEWSLQREGDLAILTVDGFAGGDGGRNDRWTPFLSDTFQSLRRDRVQRLIVDLRENEGGMDQAMLLLMRHLIRKRLALPQVSTSVTYQTVPDDLRPFLSTWDDSFYDRRRTSKPRGDGRFELTDRGRKIRALAPVRDAFVGDVVLLTGPVNSSASHTFARLLKGLPHVTLVGRETGGNLRASTGGNIFFMRLPATGFEVDIPLIAYEWPGENRDGGVLPDIECTEARALECAKQRFVAR